MSYREYLKPGMALPDGAIDPYLSLPPLPRGAKGWMMHLSKRPGHPLIIESITAVLKDGSLIPLPKRKEPKR